MLCVAREWPDMAQQATIVISAKFPGTNGLIMLWCCSEKNKFDDGHILTCLALLPTNL